MSGTTKLILYILLAVFAGWIAVKILMHVLAMLIPILIIGAVVVLVVSIVSRKALGGGRRTLP